MSIFTSVPPLLWLILFAVGLVVLFITRDRTSRQRLLSLLGYVLIIIILLAAIPAIRPYPGPSGAFVTAEEQARFARTFGGVGVTEQVSQNYYVVTEAAPLEGDYSTWTLYDSHEDTDLGSTRWDAYAIFNPDETKALFFDADNFLKPYDVATKTVGSSLLVPMGVGEATFAWPYTTSVRWKYKLFINAVDEDMVYIFKDGSLLKTIKNTDLGLPSDQKLMSATISPSGKYIVVVASGAYPYNGKWLILEGS